METSHDTAFYLTEKEYSSLSDLAERCDGGMSVDAILRTLVRLLDQLDVDISEIKAEDQLLGCLKNVKSKD